MAKRPRMGRNLNALLGSNAKARNTQNDASATDTVGVDGSEEHNSATTALDLGQADNAPAYAESDVDSTQSYTAPRLMDAPVKQGATTDHFSDQVPVEETSKPIDAVVAKGKTEQLIMLGVEKIRRGTYQPRRLFDQELLQELADSIKAEGMIQPIIVRPFADGYELVAGERRWRASQLAGIDRIPAIVRDMEDRSVAAVSVIENIQRKDLNPLEEAEAFARLCDEFGMTHKAVAEAVGRSRASVTNLMRLLDLHEDVKVMVDKGELEMGHARALLGAPRHVQTDIARRVIKQGMTVRAVETYVRSLDEEGKEVRSGNADSSADPDIERLSKKLGDTLGAKVQITHKDSGAGKLQISYSSVSELQGILAHIK